VAYLLGIDSGTTNVKAAVFDSAGGCLDSVSVECCDVAMCGDRAEIVMRTYWDAVAACIRRIGAQGKVRLADIDALSVSSQGVTFVPVDDRGDEIGRAIYIHDMRAEQEARRILELFGGPTLYETAGQPAVNAMFEAARLLWMRDHEPERFARIHKVLLVHDYLIHRLTGEYVTVPSIQSSSLLLDIGRWSWWPAMLEFIGLSEAQLPRICAHGEAVGRLTPRAAQETSLPPTTLVVTGGIDQVCGMIGVQNTEKGILSESTGSVLALHTLSDAPFPSAGAGVFNFCAFGGRRYALVPFCSTAGAALRWFKEAFCAEETLHAQAAKEDVYDVLVREASRVPPGSDGLVMLPYLSGSGSPAPDLRAKGVFYGMTLAHGKAHFLRALLEAVACLLRSNLDALRNAGMEFREIRSFGGGSRSPVWSQIKADICGLPVRPSHVAETGCMGAAVLAGVGSGVYAGIEEGSRALACFDEMILPDPARRPLSEEIFRRYEAVRTAVEPLRKH
jgi:sugar (pentulose or hexulose) kinase